MSGTEIVMNGNLKNTFFNLFLVMVFFMGISVMPVKANNWYDTYMIFCNQRGIVTGDENGDLMPDEFLTREQMVKIIIKGLSIDMTHLGSAEYDDITADRWSYPYICKYQEYVIEQTKNFNPTEFVKREEFLAMSIKMSTLGSIKPSHMDAMKSAFKDWEQIDEKYIDYIAVGYEKNCIAGSQGYLKPKDNLTRAEACSLIYKLIYAEENELLSNYYQESLNKPENENSVNRPSVNETVTSTPLVGESVATLEQAKTWAKNRGAAQRYIDIADLYWKYGEITGLRADVLYAQAAKETNFGKYTGQVKPEQNNWAGIKKYGATGDEPEDHEDFATPEDGVRGHFNHMCAYVGLDPVGTPHGRYNSVKTLAWAGTVKTVEELGGKWAPNPDYGKSIVNDFLNPMIETKVN